MINLEIILKTFLPSVVVDNFELVKIDENDNDTGKQLSIFFDEKFAYPDGHSSETLESKGFRKKVGFHDFPIQNKEVKLYIRRRKWLVKDTGNIISKSYDFKHKGTNYSNGLASFLKEGA